jgi:hypothetical protein
MDDKEKLNNVIRFVHEHGLTERIIGLIQMNCAAIYQAIMSNKLDPTKYSEWVELKSFLDSLAEEEKKPVG